MRTRTLYVHVLVHIHYTYVFKYTQILPYLIYNLDVQIDI